MRRILAWGALGLVLAGLVGGCASEPLTGKARSRLPQQAAPQPAPKEPPPVSPENAPTTETPQAPTAPSPAALYPAPADLTRLPLLVNRADGSEMVRVPAGDYLVTEPGAVAGSDFGGQARLTPVPLPGFYIDRLEITTAQFKRFDSKYQETEFTEGQACLDCPAMGVTRDEARAYCAWAGKRLPTEAEWEAAARAATSRPYPWGTVYEAQRANLSGPADGHTGPAPVGSYPLGASPYGAQDLTGNVWEWVETEPTAPAPPAGTASVARTASAASTASAAAPDSKTPPAPAAFGLVKGGGYRSPPNMAVLSSRNRVPVDMRNPTFGFRCVKAQ